MRNDAKAASFAVIKTPGGYAICRNDAPLKTPAGAGFVLPTPDLAECIAEEARAQIGKPKPLQAPFTQLAATAIDLVPKTRDNVIDRMIAYAGSELLCHRAEEPMELAEEQNKIWQPLLDWCAERFKAPLRCGTGIMPVGQPRESLEALRRAIAAYDDFRLVGLSEAAGITGSIVLALALAERHITAAQAFHAAELDAAHQMEKWGEDPEARTRLDAIKCDLEICAQWFALL